MIPYATYRLLHLTGLALLLFALGGTAALSRVAKETGERAEASRRQAQRRLAALHGVALLAMLLGGMGMLARMGIAHDFRWPAWIWIKVGAWLALGLFPLFLRRVPAALGAAWALVVGVVGVAAYAAITKP